MGRTSLIVVAFIASLTSCGKSTESVNNGTNNTTNNTTTNTTNNGSTNNGSTNNGSTNNGSTNNGSTNNGSTNNAQGIMCSTAQIIAGSTADDGSTDRTQPGAGLFDDPTLLYQDIDFIGDKMVIAQGREVWFFDLTGDRKLQRIAGLDVDNNDPNFRVGVPCAEARFAKISDLSVMPDGRIVLSDINANGILEIVDPFGANCRVEPVAGTREEIDRVNPGSPPNVGTTDGPGATAKFSLAAYSQVAADGTIYVVDRESDTVRAIADDAARTVTTVADYGDLDEHGSVLVGNALYITGGTFTKVKLLKVDLTSGDVTTVFEDNNALEGSGSTKLLGAASNGTEIFTVHLGYLYAIGLDGNVRVLAGTGDYFDYSGGKPDYITNPTPVDMFQFVHGIGNPTSLTSIYMQFRAGKIYAAVSFRGQYYVVQFNC